MRAWLEVALERSAARTLINDLSRKLEQWTGRRWTVIVSNEAGQPTRVCMWSTDCHIQSLDITGWSTTELNLHRSKLVDVSATIEMASSARRLLGRGT